MCADQQGKFWEYRAEIFGGSWGKNNVEDLKAIAKKTGLKEKEFNTCLDTDKTKERVSKDVSVAGGLGVKGTPAFFLNGKFMNGVQPVENFEKMIKSQTEHK